MRASISLSNGETAGRKSIMCHDVRLHIDPRRDLDQFEASCDQAKHAALRHVEHLLTRLKGICAAKGTCAGMTPGTPLHPRSLNLNYREYTLNGMSGIAQIVLSPTRSLA